jgi:hypothetical protein
MQSLVREEVASFVGYLLLSFVFTLGDEDGLRYAIPSCLVIPIPGPIIQHQP